MYNYFGRLSFKDEVFNRPKKELEKEGRYWKEKDFDHGRIEIREYYVENEVEWLRENHPGWKGLSGMGACVATVTENGKTTTALSYSIYSQEEMKAEEYGKGKRAHWGIENSLHWVLDIVFREDRLRSKEKNGIHNLGLIRRFVMFIMKLLKVYYNRSMKRIRAKIGRNLEREMPVILSVLKVLYDNDMLDAIDELVK